MGSRGGGGCNGEGSQAIPSASRKMVQSLKEIVNGVPEAEIYSTLKDCNMDPNEAVNRLLSQDTFHEVKSKREKKKEFKDTTDSRTRGGGSTSNRGARSGTERYAAHSGGFQGKSTYRRENGTSSSIIPTTASRVGRNVNWQPPTYSDSLGLKNESSTLSAADGVSVSQPPSASGFQSAWLGAPGQKSMADIVKMGRPQNKGGYNTSQQSISHNLVPEEHPEYDNTSPDNEWPSIEQPQADSGLKSGPESNLSFDRSHEEYHLGYETNEVEAQDESSSEDHIENHVEPEPAHDNDPFRNIDSYNPHDDACEHKDAEGVDALVSSMSANIQKLSVQEEEHMEQPEEDIPSLIIPNHLQVHTADCSHLNFGSFGANINSGFSGPSSADHSETTNLEYYDEGSTRTLTGAENYELPSSQTSVLKQEDPEVTHGGHSQSQYGFPPVTLGHTFDSPELTNLSFPQSQTPQQTQISTPFLNAMQDAVNVDPVRESDLSYSQFSVSQSMPSRYSDSASSISDPTISMAEALKNAGLSSSQPAQQTSLSTAPALPHHLIHPNPYSQPGLPLGPFANMIGYPFLPQSYTYMPSGFQPTFAGNSTYHQQLAAMLPQYKNSVSVSSLPQSAAVASGYGSFGNSAAISGNYQVSQPAAPSGSTISYDDVLSARYKDNAHLLSLQQQNDNSPMWVHGGGSRTMPAVPASAYYSLQGQNQQQGSGFRQAQQASQNYVGAALNYPDFFHSQAGISQEHQLQQNPRDVGSQGQPKLQSQQLWQNGY